MITTGASLTKVLGSAKAVTPLLLYVLPPLHWLDQTS
jgi:hypothetical protein